MSDIYQKKFGALYEDIEQIEQFVPYKFLVNLFDEMSYHKYTYEFHDIDEIVQIVFSHKNKKTEANSKKLKRVRRVVTSDDKNNKTLDIDESTINVLILFHEKQNKHYLLSRKMDFDKNIRRYIIEGIENIIIFDSEEVQKSAIKHTKSITNAKFVFRGVDTYIRNINNTLSKGYSIAEESEIKHIETMRVLPSFSSVVPQIDENDVICRMLRVKKDDIIKYEGFDPTVKSFTVKYFLVR